MKLQILRSGQTEGIEGYTAIRAEVNALSLDIVADNQCDVILAPDIVDSFSLELIDTLIVQVLKKLRMGGKLVIGGTDIRLFAKAINNGVLELGQASRIVSSVHSMISADTMVELLRQKGLRIDSFHFDGLHFEINVQRVK